MTVSLPPNSDSQTLWRETGGQTDKQTDGQTDLERDWSISVAQCGPDLAAD